MGIKVGDIVKVVDESQFAHVVKIGQVMDLWVERGALWARILNWGPPVKAANCIPVVGLN